LAKASRSERRRGNPEPSSRTGRAATRPMEGRSLENHKRRLGNQARIRGRVVGKETTKPAERRKERTMANQPLNGRGNPG
jgi:hypothetical protein